MTDTTAPETKVPWYKKPITYIVGIPAVLIVGLIGGVAGGAASTPEPTVASAPVATEKAPAPKPTPEVTVEAPAPPPPAPEPAPAPAPAPEVSVEQQYLEAIVQVYPGGAYVLYDDAAKAEALRIGYQVCEGLSLGGSEFLTGFALEIYEQDAETQQLGAAVIAASVYTLCPEHQPIVEDWIARFSG